MSPTVRTPEEILASRVDDGAGFRTRFQATLHMGSWSLRGGYLQRRQQPLDQARVEEGRIVHRVALRVKDAEGNPVALLVEQPELGPELDPVVAY